VLAVAVGDAIALAVAPAVAPAGVTSVVLEPAHSPVDGLHYSSCTPDEPPAEPEAERSDVVASQCRAARRPHA